MEETDNRTIRERRAGNGSASSVGGLLTIKANSYVSVAPLEKKPDSIH